MSSSGGPRERVGGYLKQDLFFAEEAAGGNGERRWRYPGETLLIGYTIKQC